MMRLLLVVAAGGALGSVLRYLMQRLFNPVQQDAFSMGTWLVNLLGCLLIGIGWGLSEKYHSLSEDAKLFLFTGLCGGFTTLSAFSHESMLLIKEDKFSLFGLYAIATIVGGWVVTWAGYKLIAA
jgi:CrcB protein